VFVLAWDTATNLTRLGLGRIDSQGQVESLETRTGEEGSNHSATLPLEIDSILSAHSLKAADLGLVAVGRGPGSFTGLRTGLALAKGLALGANIPALGISTLTILAGAVPNSPPRPRLVAPLIDARHNELFTRLYRLRADSPLPEPLSEILTLSPALVAPTIKALDSEGEGVLLLGPAINLLPPSLDGLSLGSSDLPDPLVLAIQAAYALSHSLLADCPVTPLYGRTPDIFKKWTPPTRLTSGQP
jgi:tRNA threonylcarbamoyl adenosine modification protein YeaZ